MVKSPSSKAGAGKSPRGKVARKTSAKPKRAALTLEHPKNLIVADDDTAAVNAVAQQIAESNLSGRVSHRRSAVDRLDDPKPAESQFGLVERVGNAIERELSRIEIIIGGGAHTPPAMRTETESRARVLASLARTLKEVMRLREQERDRKDEAAKADDDSIPRDLDTLRSELARRLEVIVGEATQLHPDATE